MQYPMYGAPKKPISNVQKVPKSNIPMYNNILLFFSQKNCIFFAPQAKLSMH